MMWISVGFEPHQLIVGLGEFLHTRMLVQSHKICSLSDVVLEGKKCPLSQDFMDAMHEFTPNYSTRRGQIIVMLQSS